MTVCKNGHTSSQLITLNGEPELIGRVNVIRVNLSIVTQDSSRLMWLGMAVSNGANHDFKRR